MINQGTNVSWKYNMNINRVFTLGVDRHYYTSVCFFFGFEEQVPLYVDNTYKYSAELRSLRYKPYLYEPGIFYPYTISCSYLSPCLCKIFKGNKQPTQKIN